MKVQLVLPQDLATTVMAWTPAQTAYERGQSEQDSSTKAAEF